MAKNTKTPALRVGGKATTPAPKNETGRTEAQTPTRGAAVSAARNAVARPAATSTEQGDRNRAQLAGARAASGAAAMPGDARSRPGTPRPATTAASRGNASVPVRVGTPQAEAASRAVTTAARAGTTSQQRGAPRRGPVAMNQPRPGSSGGRPSAAQNPSNRPTVRVAREGGTGSVRGIRVEAVAVGYYGHERKRPGDVFTIKDMEEFSDAENDRYVEEEVTAGGKTRMRKRRLPRGWMRLVDPATPTRTTTPNEAIRQQHDEILASRMQDRSTPEGRASALRGNEPPATRPNDSNPLEDDDPALDDRE